jgi:hypothetical protein
MTRRSSSGVSAHGESPGHVRTHGHHGHGHEHGHAHSHGLVDPSIKRSRDGLRVVGISLFLLGLTAIAQGAIYIATNSVALLADLIHTPAMRSPRSRWRRRS